MDGFNRIPGCTKAVKLPVRLPPQFQPGQTPNAAALATKFALSDRTFEDGPMPSWGMHVSAVAATLNGFVGGIPTPGRRGPLGPGWGCDSGNDTGWLGPNGIVSRVPACVPDYSLDPHAYPYGGAYRATPVKYVPTIMDELTQAGLSWRIYAGLGGTGNSNGYGWAICPTFAECLHTQQNNLVDNRQVLADAASGTLPSFSVVTPTQARSQHNGDSMALGDNWVGSVVSAIENGPDWKSTAIFLTWDDCGCFYDHVAPPSGFGIRVPMIIASPYAIAGHTDSTPASYASVLAFTEHIFGLPALSSLDAAAYDYLGSFNFGQAPLAGAPMVQTTLGPAELRQLAANPADSTDPT